MLIRLSDSDAENLAYMLEAAFQQAHEMTMSEDAEEATDGEKLMDCALRVLREVDPEHPLHDVDIRPGEAVDWDEILDGEEEEATADEEDHATQS